MRRAAAALLALVAVPFGARAEAATAIHLERTITFGGKAVTGGTVTYTPTSFQHAPFVATVDATGHSAIDLPQAGAYLIDTSVTLPGFGGATSTTMTQPLRSARTFTASGATTVALPAAFVTVTLTTDTKALTCTVGVGANTTGLTVAPGESVTGGTGLTDRAPDPGTRTYALLGQASGHLSATCDGWPTALPISFSTSSTKTFALGLAGHILSFSHQPDPVPPTITPRLVPPGQLNAAGWSTGPVRWAFTCADDQAVVICPGDHDFMGDGADQSFTGAATDTGGNAAFATVRASIDSVAPRIALTTRNMAIVTDRMLRGTAGDDTSGIATIVVSETKNGSPATVSTTITCRGPGSSCPWAVNVGTGMVSASAVAYDVAGNVSARTGTVSFLSA